MTTKQRLQRLPTTHRVKTNSTHFQHLKEGQKKFDVRFDDKDYKLEDTLIFEEYKCPASGSPTPSGESVEFKIIYILRRFKGLELGYIIIGLDN